MDFYLQMGHGMQSIIEKLIETWDGGTVIASPVNITQKSLLNFSKRVNKNNGKILFDPQMYSLRDSHSKLKTYSYWPQESVTYIENNNYFDSILKPLIALNKEIESEAIILPSSNIDKVSREWNLSQIELINTAEKYNVGQNKKDIYHSVSLDQTILLNESDIEMVVNFVSKWDVQGIYLTCEPPKNQYLVTEPNWLTNLMSLVAGIKRVGKKVIVGYANHQYLCLSLSKCDAIASGNFLNIRSFQKSRFKDLEKSGGGKRATWFYSPLALSEYKTSFLDIAKRSGVLGLLKPADNMTNEYSSMLFTDALPSSTSYNERQSFLHYLNCLKIQVEEINTDSYKENYNYLELQLQTAEKILNVLNEKGIKGQDRDFTEIVDVNQAAIILFNDIYGFPLSMEWDSL